MKKGKLISLEGGEGAGKSTLAARLKKELEDKGYVVLISREPGGSKISEQIRTILLDPDNTGMAPVCEAALYAASRAQHAAEVIVPALNEGKIVLCDRYLDSSMVYQGLGRNLGFETVMELNRPAIQNCMPEATLYLSLPAETGLERARARGKLNRLDQEPASFHERVKEGYDLLAGMYPERIHIIDASKTEDEVLKAAMDIIENLL